MPDKVQPIPEEYSGITPYLIVKGAANALQFYRKAFEAKELMRFDQDDGRIGHAEMQVGKARFMLADEFPEMNIRSPQSFGGTGCGFLLYVEDVDAVFDRTIGLGATISKPVQDQFYGDRSGTLIDPFGHKWTIATHIEDISREGMERRASAGQK